MKLENFDSKNVTVIQKELDEFVKALCKKYGIQYGHNRASYQQKEIRFTITVKAEGVSQQDIDLAKMLDYPEIGARFTNLGELYEVIGWEFKRPKFPIRCKVVSADKIACFTPAVKSAIEKYKNQAVK